MSGESDTQATLTISSASSFKIGAVTATTGPASGVVFTPAAALDSAATSFTVSVTGLTSGVQYVFSATGLTDANDANLDPTSSDSDPTCTSEQF